MQYFDHDTDAATDPKVMQLRLECGGAAVDAYWYLVEQMHRDERPICISNASAMRVHCHTLCTDCETLEKWIETMIFIGLLDTDENDENIYSERTMENIEKYQAKQEKARSAAESRWGNANAKQTHSKRNANGMPRKEKKRKSSNAIKSITTTEATVGAAAVETAPPDAEKGTNPYCPMCDSLLSFDVTNNVFKCPVCGDSFKAEKVTFR